MSILYVYSNKIFISLPTQPPTHTHNPHQYHTGIHTTHQQKTRKTNPTTRSTHPESTQPSNTIHTIQQPGIETNLATQSTQPTRNRLLALSNKINASGGDGKNEKQDRHLQRQAVAMVMAMARDIQPYSTRNLLIKPIQPENNEKQRKKKRSAATAMAIDGS